MRNNRVLYSLLSLVIEIYNSNLGAVKRVSNDL